MMIASPKHVGCLHGGGCGAIHGGCGWAANQEATLVGMRHNLQHTNQVHFDGVHDA